MVRHATATSHRGAFFCRRFDPAGVISSSSVKSRSAHLSAHTWLNCATLRKGIACSTPVSAITSVTKATVKDAPDPITGATVLPPEFTGDAMPRSILSAIRNELVTTGSSGNLSVLSQLGINTSQTDGTLSLDSTKFAAAIDKGLGGDVQQLLAGSGNGSNGLIAWTSAARRRTLKPAAFSILANQA